MATGISTGSQDIAARAGVAFVRLCYAEEKGATKSTEPVACSVTDAARPGCTSLPVPAFQLGSARPGQLCRPTADNTPAREMGHSEVFAPANATGVASVPP
jgi:hypothetical protein